MHILENHPHNDKAEERERKEGFVLDLANYSIFIM